jgi:FSR family fosmidomycin resistance protein-like MFS transporter
MVGIMTLLLSIISFRSVIQTGMVAFIPLYLLTLPGGTKEEAAFLLAVFLFAGAIGTLIGGRLADRLGSKNVMGGSMVVTCPALLIFLNTSGLIQIVSIAIAGAALISASSLTVVMAQAVMPKSIGLASGLTLGLGFGAGGLGAAALGKYADWFGISQTMLIIAFLPLVILALSLFMPTARTSMPTPQPVPVPEMASPSEE